jgi:hypothetical protein
MGRKACYRQLIHERECRDDQATKTRNAREREREGKETHNTIETMVMMIPSSNEEAA